MPVTITERAWRLDSVEAHPAVSDLDEGAETPDSLTGSTDFARQRVAETCERAGFIERWNRFARTWARTRLERLGVPTLRFATVLHEFTAIIETADNHVTVEAALLRHAQRMAPEHRVELNTTSAPYHFQKHQIVLPGEGAGAAGASSLSESGNSQNGQSTQEVPLRCGAVVRGRLQIRAQSPGVASLSKETIRRLTTLCTLSACELERLDHHVGWTAREVPAAPEDAAGADTVTRAGSACATFASTKPLHDATFLNAVLPFALNQARRHDETLSLVCVAIDRLGGIQELMGRAVAEQLIQSVGETVAVLIRASDIVARLDDDRILAVLPRAPGGGALHVAQKICDAVAKKCHDGDEIPHITVSIGVATYPACADNVFALFDAADEALARAQSEGRNRALLAPRFSALVSSQLEPVPS